MTCPQIDDEPLTLACFALEDIRETLRHITVIMREIRQKPHWKAAELTGYKEARRELSRFLPKAIANDLSAQEHAQLQTLLVRYASGKAMGA